MSDSSDDQTSERAQQTPPGDMERLEVLARVIGARISELNTHRTFGRFTPALARELYVLEQLRDEWLLEGRPKP